MLSVLQLLKSNHSLMLILAFADDNLLEVFGWSSTRNIQQNSLLYFWVEIFLRSRKSFTDGPLNLKTFLNQYWSRKTVIHKLIGQRSPQNAKP